MGKKRITRKRQSSLALRRNGLSAFEAQSYSKAIVAWERVRRQAPDMMPLPALAEVYFRRGLRRLYGTANSQDGLDDLRKAADLQPDDSRILYHLGLAAHREGDLDEAVGYYRQVRREDGGLASRAAYPLALALSQRGEDPAQIPVWSALEDEERVMLESVSAFQRRPYVLSDEAPLLYRGVAALDAGDTERATAMLDAALDGASTPVERQMALYYQGVLAAQREDWEEALRAWNAAGAAGLAMERLDENLQECYHRLAEERLDRGDVEGALVAGQEALRHGAGYPSLEALVSQAHQRLAYQAAYNGRWAEARKHWRAAEAVEDGSFRLAYNLALAEEEAEDFLAAGKRWREALRRRPRTDDHPDTLSDDQVARLWQRAAEAYTKAGEFDEAVQVYRTAIKWNPDRLEARVALSEALLLNGQADAAANELDRVLARDPDNVSALLRMAEVVYARGPWGGSPAPYCERVLALDPDNTTARQMLVDFCQDQADDALRWGDYERALRMYRQALNYWPGHPRASAALGALYVRLDDREKAQPHLEEALQNARGDLRVYEEIIHAWLDVGDAEGAWDLLERAEAEIETIPYEFYVAQASYCMSRVDEGEELVALWLERAVEKAPPGAPVLVTSGEMAVASGAFDLARAYLEQAIACDQLPGQAHLLLGIVAFEEGNTARAEMHWSDALRIARRNDDQDLMERVEMARFALDVPPELLDLLDLFGPGPLLDGPLPDFFFDDFADFFELDEW